MQDLVFFWWRIFKCVHTPDFHDALFQTQLNVGRAMLSKSLLLDYPDIVRDLNQGFGGFGLTTGVHMENLWKTFRPVAPVSEEQLRTLLQLEDLARRFDTIRWNA